MRLSILAAAAAVFTTLGSSPLHAEYLIGVSWSGAVYRFDDPLGAPHLLKQTSYLFNSLAQDSSGQLFATAPSSFNGLSDLIKIDPSNGSTTNLGTILSTFEWSLSGAIVATTFSKDDTFFGIYSTRVNGQVRNQLITIDRRSSWMRLVGDISPRIMGLTTDSGGNIYATTLATRDGAAGGIALLDPLALTLHDLFDGDDIDTQTIAMNSSGHLFAARTSVRSYDLSTGSYGPQGVPTTLDLRGMEFVVPEPTVVALASAGFAGLSVLRRKT